ncbi:thiol-disulfide oxidoreductase DCC family protein [Zobellella taiwanensis]
MLTVFFDGRCGLCRREIRFYQRRARAGSIRWLDVWQHGDDMARHGLGLEQCLQQLHLLDEHQQLHTGVDAFVLLWRQVPTLRPLARLAGLAPVRALLALGYRLFLCWYRRRPHLRACRPPQS